MPGWGRDPRRWGPHHGAGPHGAPPRAGWEAWPSSGALSRCSRNPHMPGPRVGTLRLRAGPAARGWTETLRSHHFLLILNTKTIIPILPAFRSLFINDLFCYTSPCSFFFLLASFKNILVSSLKKFLTQPHVPLQLLPYVSLTIHSKTSRELPTLTVFPSAFTPLLNCSHRSRKMTSINITRITSLPELIA